MSNHASPFVVVIAAHHDTQGAGRLPQSCASRSTTIYAALLNQARAGIVDFPAPPLARYGIAALVILAIALMRAALFASFPSFFLFTPAVVVIALFLGGKAGLLATLLATVSAGMVFRDIGPIGSLSPVQWTITAVFAATNLGLIGLVIALRHALIEATSARAELAGTALAAVEREAFLASVLASSTDCIEVLDLDGGLTFMSEGGQRVTEVGDLNAVQGQSWPDFWVGTGNTEAITALAAARDGQAHSFIGRASTMRGTSGWWHVAVSPIPGPNGRTDRILSVSRDITDLRESEDERDRFVRLAEASTDFIGMAHIDGRVFYLNDAARRMVGVDDADITALTIADFFPPDQVAAVADQILPTVDRDGHWSGETTLRHFKTGEAIPVHQAVFSVIDSDGQRLAYGTVTRDFRAHKRAEEELRLINGELAHRLKNVLAVVQSITRQTLRGAPDVQTASEALSARLVALGAATDVLTNSSWRSADLREVIAGALAPHGEIGTRIRLDGPRVTLQPQVTVALALALHELATNAVKYGALSNDTGTVTVEWRVEGEGPDARFHLDWRERGGPPVAEPTRRGFGSTLIERSLRSYFGGSATIQYRLDGLAFAMDARMGDAAVMERTA